MSETKEGVPLTADQQAELDRQAKVEAETARLAPYHEALADFNAHPHTQLTAISKSLVTVPGDVHTRINTVHSAVSRLVQMMLTKGGDAPEKPEHPDEIERRKVESVERPQGQVAPGG